MSNLKLSFNQSLIQLTKVNLFRRMFPYFCRRKWGFSTQKLMFMCLCHVTSHVWDFPNRRSTIVNNYSYRGYQRLRLNLGKSGKIFVSYTFIVRNNFWYWLGLKFAQPLGQIAIAKLSLSKSLITLELTICITCKQYGIDNLIQALPSSQLSLHNCKNMS